MKYVRDIVDYYLSSPQFLALRGKTQHSYAYRLMEATQTQITNDRTLGDYRLSSLNVSLCKIAYQSWLKRGVRTANLMATVLSVALKMAEELELINRNPMRLVKKMKTQQRKTMWTTDQVKTFLDTAYSDYKWRSIGLIVHMAYTFAQRVGDMRSLKWDNINFDERRLDLEQSKKRAEVHLPIGDNMYKMLQDQYEDFGFQPYVAPHPFPRSGSYVIYRDVEISPIVNAIKKKANLPEDITAMDMRRTAITEMVEAGVDTTQIMAVSGHNSPSSMSPYIKHTFNSASNALNKREEYKNA